jgi:predicted RNase H-like HicB family nuclease
LWGGKTNREVGMPRAFTLEYWQDEGWFVGRLREVPGVFSQGKTLEELEDNVRDAYQLLLEDQPGKPHPGAQLKEIELRV